MDPLLLINLKAYSQGTGSRAVALARTAQSLSERGAAIALAAQAADIFRLAQTGATVFSQHVDPVAAGAFTGSILPEAVKEAGASGTLLNHAERRLAPPLVEQTLRRCREAGLKAVVCASTLEEAQAFIRLAPDGIALEDPSLIGTGRSVAAARPATVRRFAAALKGTGIAALCGAGISTADDVRAALRLGCAGVLVSSAVVTAPDPAPMMTEMAQALR